MSERTKRRKVSARWSDELLLQDQTIIGCIERDCFGRGWWAYGCARDWQDVKLGLHATAAKARRAVKDWVRTQQ